MSLFILKEDLEFLDLETTDEEARVERNQKATEDLKKSIVEPRKKIVENKKKIGILQNAS